MPRLADPLGIEKTDPLGLETIGAPADPLGIETVRAFTLDEMPALAKQNAKFLEWDAAAKDMAAGNDQMVQALGSKGVLGAAAALAAAPAALAFGALMIPGKMAYQAAADLQALNDPEHG